MLKYAIVTGASPSSIGFLAAKKLVQSGEFKVILACRNEEKGLEAERLIRSEIPSSTVQYMHLDLASFDSIRKFVSIVHDLDDGDIFKKEGLSVLVNNAGIGWGKDTPFCETKDGLEEIVGVNHFGTFLLTQLLLDDLKRAKNGRVVIVASSLHDPNSWKGKKSTVEDELKLAVPNFPNGILKTKEDYDGFNAYQVSKLCNLWYTYELQRRLNEEDSSTTTTTTVKVNAVSPGFIPTTGLTRRSGMMGTFFLRYVLDPLRHVGMGVTRSPDEGAEVIFQASTSDVGSVGGGQYFELPKGKDTIAAISSSEESMDQEKAKTLWDLSIETCKL